MSRNFSWNAYMHTYFLMDMHIASQSSVLDMAMFSLVPIKFNCNNFILIFTFKQ